MRVVVPLAWRWVRSEWMVVKEDFFWFVVAVLAGGVGFGQVTRLLLLRSAAVDGFCGFAGWGGEDDVVVAGGGSGGVGG